MTIETMRLIGSPTSPFVRKVRVLASELGIDDHIVLDVVDMADPTIDLPAYNPMRKVPTLVLANGSALFDSAVICDYLFRRFGKLADDERNWPVRTTEAVADGLLEAGLLWRYETLRPAEEQSANWIAKQMDAAGRCIAWLDGKTDWRERQVDVGQIAVGCALGWLAFRFPDHSWKELHPALAAWDASFARRPSMLATDPAKA